MCVRFCLKKYKAVLKEEVNSFFKHLCELSDTCDVSIIRVSNTDWKSVEAKKKPFLGG